MTDHQTRQHKLLEIKGIVYVKNEVNLGFVRSCNKAAAIARGEYLVFLNNDTYIKPLWLDSLILTLNSNPTNGIVGSKLVYPNGKLQEAGGIVWADGAATNFGNNSNSFDPSFNFTRHADYVSGASLLIRKTTFLSAGGFDIQYAPAYYEDTDLCFTVKHKLGLNVIYEPKSELIHFEGVSSGILYSKSGVKNNQILNQVKFIKKWSKILNSRTFLSGKNLYLAARKFCGNKTILVIDSYMPRFDRESGSNRLLHILKILKNSGFHVIFLPDNWNKEEPYNTILQNLGIETLYTSSQYSEDLVEIVQSRLDYIEVAWLCRPEITEKYGEAIRKLNPKVKIIYDTIDLHFLRLKREAELYPDQISDKNNWMKMKKTELDLATMADMVITITDVDKDIFKEENISERKLITIPNIHVFNSTLKPGFEERSGILFIGSYNHPPNIDAVIWLCEEIMPLVWKECPDIKVTLLGNNPTMDIKSLENDKISVPGFVEDVAPYFNANKIFVAPLRYGAGMKGKIGQSYEFGLPIISTTIGVEGMGLKDGLNILVADNTQSFAQKIISLNSNPLTWNMLAGNSELAIKPYSPESIKHSVELMFTYLEN